MTCEKPFPSDGDLFDKPRDSMFDDAVLGWFRTLVRRAKRCAMEAGIGMPLDDLEVLLQSTEDDNANKSDEEAAHKPSEEEVKRFIAQGDQGASTRWHLRKARYNIHPSLLQNFLLGLPVRVSKVCYLGMYSGQIGVVLAIMRLQAHSGWQNLKLVAHVPSESTENRSSKFGCAAHSLFHVLMRIAEAPECDATTPDDDLKGRQLDRHPSDAVHIDDIADPGCIQIDGGHELPNAPEGEPLSDALDEKYDFTKMGDDVEVMERTAAECANAGVRVGPSRHKQLGLGLLCEGAPLSAGTHIVAKSSIFPTLQLARDFAQSAAHGGEKLLKAIVEIPTQKATHFAVLTGIARFVNAAANTTFKGNAMLVFDNESPLGPNSLKLRITRRVPIGNEIMVSNYGNKYELPDLRPPGQPARVPQRKRTLDSEPVAATHSLVAARSAFKSFAKRGRRAVSLLEGASMVGAPRGF